MTVRSESATLILSYLEGLQLTDWNDVPLPLHFPEVVSGDDDNSDSDQPHIRVDLLDTTPRALSVSAGNKAIQYKWILQLSLYARAGIGIIKPLRVADKIASAFPVAKTIGTVDNGLKVYKPTNLIPRLTVGVWISYPIQVSVLHISK